MKILLIILIILITVFLIYAVVGGLYFFDQSVRRKPRRDDEIPTDNKYSSVLRRKKQVGIDWLLSQNAENVYITSFDNLKLCAKVLENDPKKIMIMMHGFRAEDFSDFSVSSKLFYDDGYTIILPHQRAHDQSEGKYLSYGINERKDCKMWVDWAINHYGNDCKIVLSGVSMGCATVLATLGYNLPTNVKACIADCGYTTPREIFRHVISKDKKLLPFPVVDVCNFICKIRAKYSIDEYSPLKAMETNKIPTIFIHGEQDRYVPTYMSKVNFEACKADKELLIVKGARHAASFETDSELCFKKSKAFIEKYM
ncbi:MAG: alpha/beta hydrolase [Clostridia bacterium]